MDRIAASLERIERLLDELVEFQVIRTNLESGPAAQYGGRPKEEQ